MPQNTKDAKKAAKKAADKITGTTHLVLLADESGSMGGNEEAVITGVNQFVDSFKDKDCKVTFATFDYNPNTPVLRIVLDAKKVSKVQPLTAADYAPRGGTPLFDATADMIDHVGSLVEGDEGVYMVILTDGIENASRRHTAETVAKLIKRREKDGWGFIYLGANHDARSMATSLGLTGAGKAAQFTSSAVGTASAMRSVSALATNYYGDGAPEGREQKLRRTTMANASYLKSLGGDVPEDDGEGDDAS